MQKPVYLSYYLPTFGMSNKPQMVKLFQKNISLFTNTSQNHYHKNGEK